MKKLIYLAIVLLFSTSAFAQAGPEKKRENRMHDFTPEQIAIILTKKMTLALDLTKQQQEGLLLLNTELAQERREHREERKALKEKGVQLTSQEKFDKINERLDRQIEIHEKMKSLLSEEQYALWKQHQLKKGNKRIQRFHQKRNG
jgi:protein CpxP